MRADLRIYKVTNPLDPMLDGDYVLVDFSACSRFVVSGSLAELQARPGPRPFVVHPTLGVAVAVGGGEIAISDCPCDCEVSVLDGLRPPMQTVNPSPETKP